MPLPVSAGHYVRLARYCGLVFAECSCGWEMVGKNARQVYDAAAVHDLIGPDEKPKELTYVKTDRDP